MSELKYISNENNDKLQTKDLITLGLYTILLFLLMGVGLAIGTFVSSILFGGKVYFAIYTSVVAALFAAPAFSLVFNKINKKFSIFIMVIITALFMVMSGHAILGSVVLFFVAFICEYFYRKNNEYLSYLFFSLGNIGAVLPLYFMKDSYIAHLKGKNYPQSKIDFILQSSNMETLILIVVLTVFCSILGTYIARKIYFKNFAKAGL